MNKILSLLSIVFFTLTADIDAQEEKIELKYTTEELVAMDKWNGISIDQLIDDAFKGDNAGLYMLGMFHLYGMGGCSIDVSTANLFFAASASLGYAPAIDKIKSMYLEDHQNIFLMMVYVNLTASFGHHEFIMVYHEQRSKLVQRFGAEFAQEIESIAKKKKSVIFENIKELEDTSDKEEFVSTIIFGEKGVLAEDVFYDNNYWKSLFKASRAQK